MKNKFKVFLFAPKNEQLERLLAQHNNVREAVYVRPNETIPYMRVRVRQFSNGVVGIAKQFASVAGPIVEYSVGENQGSKMVGTIRIPEVERYQDVVALVEDYCRRLWPNLPRGKKHSKDDVFFTCRVSKVVARTEDAHSWVEIFAVERREISRERWQAVVSELADIIGGEANFYSASVTEY